MGNILVIIVILVATGHLVFRFINHICRHDENSKLKGDLLDGYTEIFQRINSLLNVLQMTRLELKRLPDCEENRNTIEILSKLFCELEESLKTIEFAQELLKNFDVKEGGRALVATTLQQKVSIMSRMLSNIKSVEDTANRMKDRANRMKEIIERQPRSEQGGAR